MTEYYYSLQYNRNIHNIYKVCAALNNMQSIWKLKLSEGLKKTCSDQQLNPYVYSSVTWTLTQSIEKKGDGAYTRMIHAVTNISWRDHLTNEQLYGDIPKISKYEFKD